MTTLVENWRSGLPEGWGWTKLSRVARLGTGHTPDRNRPELWENATIPWVTAADLSRRSSAFEPLVSTQQAVSEVGIANSAAVLHPAGTVMLCRTASVGLFCEIGRPMATTQAFVTWTPSGDLLSRYLLYVIAAMGPEWTRLAYGSTHLTIYFPDIEAVSIPFPPVEEQRRIADFLDDRVARIDQIIAGRRQQQTLLETSLVRASFDTIKGDPGSERRESGLPWLGSIPASWPILTVSTEFQVDLGKMLDEKRQTGESSIPYLRNTNVQWDRVDVTDLKSMDIDFSERERYCVRRGDLLICEGGQPGRSAVWLGNEGPLGFQKALHRARSRGRSRPAWLLECLRVATHLNVFAVENGQTTIGHLTNEQLRSLRLPFPDPPEQDRLLEALHARQSQSRATVESLAESIALLQEYKQSLITAAVTGEIDVSTAGSGIQG